MVIPLAAVTSSLGPIAMVTMSAAIFILLWQILGSVFFKPYLAMLIERQERTVGDEGAADAALRETEETDKAIDEALTNARNDALKRRDSKLVDAKSQADKIISRAQELADKELAGARLEIDKLVDDSRREMAPEIEALSQQLIEKTITSGASIN